MIKILHIISGLREGGAERLMVDMLRRFDRQQFTSRVVSLFCGGPLVSQLEEAGIPVKILGIGGVRRWRSWARVWQEIRAVQPDIIHSHLPAACWFGLPIGRLAGVPVRIAHLQNMQPLWTYSVRWTDNLLSRFATTTLACSEGVRRFVIQEIGYSERNVRVVYNGADLSRFRGLPLASEKRRELDIPRNALVVACVASLNKEQKGHTFLIHAMTRVRAEVPEAVLLLLGDGSLRNYLEQEVQRLHLGEVVRFLGLRQDVPDVLAASDLFVLPSLWEGLPVALVEAGAAGLASVATRIDGVCEVVDEGRTGLLVEPRDSEALAGALIALLRNETQRCQMGLDARALVEERFDIECIAVYMQALYVRLLKSATELR